MMCFLRNCLMEMWLRSNCTIINLRSNHAYKLSNSNMMRLCENLNGKSTHDGNNDTHWIKVNSLNTVDSVLIEEKYYNLEVFHAKDLEKIYLKIVSEHGIQYESHTSRFASLLFSNNDDVSKRNKGSKITICFTSCTFQRYDGPRH